MFAKRLFQKATQQLQQQLDHALQEKQSESHQGDLTSIDLEPRFTLHYGIPSTSSILALDPIQSLLALGTLDGRIKVVGGDNIEALLVSPEHLPFKHLEFLQNQGFLASISNDNHIQIWDLRHRNIACKLHWESNVTAFSVIQGTPYMYIGDDNGMVYVLKFDPVARQLIQLPYLVPAESVAEAAKISVPYRQSIVGVLAQPLSHGNRLVIAYEHGLIVLWDVSENQAVLVRGYKDLEVKNKTTVDLSTQGTNEPLGDFDDELMDKEISSLCWASRDGSVLAVGYVDGDIMLWSLCSSASMKNQQAAKSPDGVVKLQLSSGDRRLPVIVLHWSPGRSPGGQLFVYGGDQIGSEEVLTILNLDWSRGITNVKCIGRVDLTLNGSFADMVLIPSTGEKEGHLHHNALLVLSNPGQLHIYDDDYLSALSNQEGKASISPLPYTMCVPTVEPQMTVSKLASIAKDGNFAAPFSESVRSAKHRAADTPSNGATKWPINGGIPSQLHHVEDHQVERIYIAGYQDGSVRIWDATYPTLSQVCVLDPEVNGLEAAGTDASVSALDICSISLKLAAGNELGLIRLYNLIGNPEDTKLHIVTERDSEVHEVQQSDGPHCIGLFSLVQSPVSILKFANSGTRLAVGFESGQVAMLDTSMSSVLFVTGCISENSPAVSLAVHSFSDVDGNSPVETENKAQSPQKSFFTFVLTKDVHFSVLDSATGNVVSYQSLYHEQKSNAISLHIIEGIYHDNQLPGETPGLSRSADNTEERKSLENCNDHERDPGASRHSGMGLMNVNVLVCCEEEVILYPLKSTFQIDNNLIRRASLVKPCCWTMVLRKDDKDYGLVLLYETGVLEIRSLPNLEVVGESSLMSILRWSFKANINKTMSSSDNGQFTMVNGCEFTFLSLLANENDFRIPESLPSLHDEVLAAAQEGGVNKSLEKNTQGALGIFSTVIRSLEGKKEDDYSFDPAHLDSIFSRPLTFESSTDMTRNQRVIELNIDDLKIDEPVSVSGSSSSSSPSRYQQAKNDEKDKKTDRERLFEGGSSYAKPRMRTREEIIAQYRKTGVKDAHSAASEARNKLAERQEKLEQLNRRTEELQNGAEDFASMAAELAKRMENRKWWNIF